MGLAGKAVTITQWLFYTNISETAAHDVCVYTDWVISC